MEAHSPTAGRSIRTPNIDRLASAGLTFTRGYVTTALCSPSLATLLTGLYPHQHGITGNDLYAPKDRPDAGGMRGDRRSLTERLLANPLLLPRELAKAGDSSLQTGKLWKPVYRRRLHGRHDPTRRPSRRRRALDRTARPAANL